MRIGIDYHPATTHWPGVGRYARELVRALVQLTDHPELALFDVGRGGRVVDERALGLSGADPRVVLVRRDLSRRLLAFGAPLGVSVETILGAVDLFHHMHAGGLRVASARQTIALAELPEAGSEAHDRLARRLARLDGVLTFSRDHAQRLTRAFAVPRERVFLVPVGCEHWRRALARLEELDDPPVLLVLGGTRRARRPVLILQAFERLVAGGLDARLAFVGAAGDAERELQAALVASPARAKVERRTEVHEHELPARVARSSVLVHLNEDEGTAVTPLEAFSVGCAVVASRLPAFEEALHGEALLIENEAARREPGRLADLLAQAIASARDGLARDRRMAIAARFTWDAAARATLSAWSQVLAAHPA